MVQMSSHTKITIVDAVMGTGKSLYALDEININHDRRYIVIVPLRTEVERYKEATTLGCNGTRQDVVAIDEDSPTKTAQFKKALKEGKTIIATHTLFTVNLDQECFDTIADFGDYHLILDETLTLVDDRFITKHDFRMLENEKIIITEPTGITGLDKCSITNKAKDYGPNGALSPFLRSAKSGHVYRVNRTTIVFVVPPDRMTSFKEVQIFTYLFDGSETNAWLDLYGLDYEHLELYRKNPGYGTRMHNLLYSGKSFASLIEIYDDKKLNAIGVKGKGKNNPLSYTWYRVKRAGYKKGNGGELDTLRKNVQNFFKNKMKGKKSTDFLWTCPTGHRDDITDRYFDPAGTETFLASNTRATNNFDNRHTLAFLLDVYPKVPVINFFKQHGIKLNIDRIALSSLIQWTWRSAIRKGEHIIVYLPSERMRRLLNGWLK